MIDEEARERAIETYYRGYRHQVGGRYMEAIQHYRQSIDLFPTAEAHTHLAWILGMKGRVEEAITECKRAIELDPHYGNPYNDIGYFLIETGHHAEALPWLIKATQATRYDHFAFPWYNLGRVYDKLGPWTKALESYRKALEISPDFDAARVAAQRLAASYN